MSLEFKLNRREKVIAFCKASGYEVPRNFDINQATFCYIAVDITQQPPTLVNRSTYSETEVIKFINAPQNKDKFFRIFDFKRFVECHYSGNGKKLAKGNAFDWNIGVSPL